MNQRESLGQEYDSLGHLTIGIPASEILFRSVLWKSDQDDVGDDTTRTVEVEPKLGFISVNSIILPLQGLSFPVTQIHLVL